MAGSFYNLRFQQVAPPNLDVSGYLNAAMKGFDNFGKSMEGISASFQDKDDARFLTGLMSQGDYASMKNWLNTEEGRRLANSASSKIAIAASRDLQNQIVTDTSADALALNQEKDKFANYFADLFNAAKSGDRNAVNKIQQSFSNGGYGASAYLGRLIQDTDVNSEASKLAMADESRVRAAKGRRELENLRLADEAALISEANANQKIADTYNALQAGKSVSKNQIALARALMNRYGITDPAKAVDTRGDIERAIKDIPRMTTQNVVAANDSFNKYKAEELKQQEINQRVANARASISPNDMQNIMAMSDIDDPDLREKYSGNAVNSSGSGNNQAPVSGSGFNAMAQRAGQNIRIEDLNSAEDLFRYRNTHLTDEAIKALPKENQEAAIAFRNMIDKRPAMQLANKVQVANAINPRNIAQKDPRVIAKVLQDAQVSANTAVSDIKRNAHQMGISPSLLDSALSANSAKIDEKSDAVNWVYTKLPSSAQTESMYALIKNQIDNVKNTVSDLNDREAAIIVYEGLTNDSLLESGSFWDYITGKRTADKDSKIAFSKPKIQDLAAKLRSKKGKELLSNYLALQKHAQTLGQVVANPAGFNRSNDVLDRVFSLTSKGQFGYDQIFKSLIGM